MTGKEILTRSAAMAVCGGLMVMWSACWVVGVTTRVWDKPKQ